MRKYREKYTLEASSSEDLSSKEIVRKAVVHAIDECIKDDILKDFFEAYREEAIEMGVLEYSAERHIQVIKDESYSMGLEDKEKELRPIIDNLTSENTFISEKNASLSKTNTSLTEKNAALSKTNASLTGENAYLRKLLEEHGIQP